MDSEQVVTVEGKIGVSGPERAGYAAVLSMGNVRAELLPEDAEAIGERLMWFARAARTPPPSGTVTTASGVPVKR